jgi:hypothetical protein
MGDAAPTPGNHALGQGLESPISFIARTQQRSCTGRVVAVNINVVLGAKDDQRAHRIIFRVRGGSTRKLQLNRLNRTRHTPKRAIAIGRMRQSHFRIRHAASEQLRDAPSIPALLATIKRKFAGARGGFCGDVCDRRYNHSSR